MPVDPTSARLQRIAAELRATGQGALLNSLRAEIRAEAAPAVKAVREAALEKLPKRGGLAAEQAEQAIRVSVLASARTAGVRMRTRTRGSFQTDKGYVRHPVFGDREDWVRQDVPQATGWWTKTLLELGPVTTARLRALIERLNRRIQAM
ncbi:MAG TPA: hypothetical protein VG497_30785 [Kribbella sp.]|nr:hypothetical protein [Kribbella sp.]